MYTIQIASKKTIKEAWKIVENLIADGYDAYIQKAYLYPEHKMWFRVRIGKYKSKAEAEIAAATISENRKQSVWIDFFREDD
jgi:cell division septation protein DedD